jgi:hypothetical protein
MPESEGSALAGASTARHLIRGAIGFGLIASALALIPSIGVAAFLLAPPGLVALRGCPMCWTIGLIETVSAGRVVRSCSGEVCRARLGAGEGAMSSAGGGAARGEQTGPVSREVARSAPAGAPVVAGGH